MLGFVKDSPQIHKYQALSDRITEALDFMRACGIDPELHPEMRTTDFYTSHEALLLGFEEAMTRVEFDRPATITRRPAISSGSAIGRARSTMPMSNSSVASRTRSA